MGLDDLVKRNKIRQDILKSDILAHIEKHQFEGENKVEYICKFFGCGRKLTIQEKLFGDKCFKHSLTKKQKYERT